MSFEFIQKLPTPEEIAAEFPISDELRKIKSERDAAIENVITGLGG